MKFTEGNKVIFSQDFRIWEGLPSDVDFEVHPIGQNSVKLVAPGYGGKPYGNGAIYVSRGMNEKQSNNGLQRTVGGAWYCWRCCKTHRGDEDVEMLHADPATAA